MTDDGDTGWLRRAAFGDQPDADVHAAAADGTPYQRWLAAVALGGQGRYAAATPVLRQLLGGREPVLGALAASTLASHRRQLGAHAVARRLDAAALGRLAGISPASPRRFDRDGVDAAGAWSDALLGLAADAVGLGRVAEARRLHTAACGLPQPSWRARVRTGWLAAEIQLAAGDPAGAVPAAESAAEEARAAGAVRHLMKSNLVLAAALTAAAFPPEFDRAAALLNETLAASRNQGMPPLVWPSSLLLAGLRADEHDTFSRIAGEALTCVFLRSDGEMRRLASASDWIPTNLLRWSEPSPNMDA